MLEPSSYGNGENAVAAKPAATATPTTTTTSTATTSTSTVTLSDAHEMFIAIGIMTGFVMFATVIAGINQDTGRAMLAIMFLLLLLQGISHVNPFVTWASNHPLQPKG